MKLGSWAAVYFRALRLAYLSIGKGFVSRFILEEPRLQAFCISYFLVISHRSF
jgi:hypothetical protein